MTNQSKSWNHIISGDVPVKMYFSDLDELEQFIMTDHEDGSCEQAYVFSLALAYFAYAVEYGHDDYTNKIQVILDKAGFRPAPSFMSSDDFFRNEGEDCDEFYNEREIFLAILEGKGLKREE